MKRVLVAEKYDGIAGWCPPPPPSTRDPAAYVPARFPQRRTAALFLP